METIKYVKTIESVVPITKLNNEWTLRASTKTALRPHTVVLIPTGIILNIPKGYGALINMDSKFVMESGLTLASGTKIVKYGNTDEIQILVQNISSYTRVIEEGRPIVNVTLIPIPDIEFVDSNAKVIKVESKSIVKGKE